MPFIGKIYAAILRIKISKDDEVDKINNFLSSVCVPTERKDKYYKLALQKKGVVCGDTDHGLKDDEVDKINNFLSSVCVPTERKDKYYKLALQKKGVVCGDTDHG
ncbi:hypothetical protein [Pedobacter borealis]|uniref:hypothetical protein n=1 Tax=Pedobacter borealis TaxID=475254 RepID=UPI000493029F|nr:hypothetical protein [Pedobacter borealis]